MFKSIKLEVIADFVNFNHIGIMIVTNKITTLLDLQTIKKYIKETYQIDSENIEFSWLLQSKLYLKIISILYLLENTNISISANVVEMIIKNNYIFNNIVIALKPRIIKVSPKSNMVIIWLDVWDIQSRSKTKSLINKCFNIGNYIATIHGANMNLGVS